MDPKEREVKRSTAMRIAISHTLGNGSLVELQALVLILTFVRLESQKSHRSSDESARQCSHPRECSQDGGANAQGGSFAGQDGGELFGGFAGEVEVVDQAVIDHGPRVARYDGRERDRRG